MESNKGFFRGALNRAVTKTLVKFAVYGGLCYLVIVGIIIGH